MLLVFNENPPPGRVGNQEPEAIALPRLLILFSLLVLFATPSGGGRWALKTLLSPPGIGGNLVAIQSSRISTHLHFHCAPGEVPDETKGCYYPCRTFCGTGQSRKTGTSSCG